MGKRVSVTAQNGTTSRARLVLEKKLGRRLRKDELAHHKDYDPSNDEPENLQALTRYQHYWITKRDKMIQRILRLESMTKEAWINLEHLNSKVAELGIQEDNLY